MSPKGIGCSHYFFVTELLSHLVQGYVGGLCFLDGEAVLVHLLLEAYVRTTVQKNSASAKQEQMRSYRNSPKAREELFKLCRTVLLSVRCKDSEATTTIANIYFEIFHKVFNTIV